MGHGGPRPGRDGPGLRSWSLLYLLRFVLAPPSTGAGLRQVVLNATPLPVAPSPAGAPGRRGGPGDRAAAGDRAARAGGRTKKARLAWWYQQDPDYGNRAAVAAVAKRLAPKVDLSEGTARAYLGQILTDLAEEGEAS